VICNIAISSKDTRTKTMYNNLIIIDC